MKCHFKKVINRQAVVSAALVLFMTATNGASADPISYSVLDHPDGAECGNDGCYVLRLDGAGGVNTFSAEAPGTGLTFTFDPAFAGVAFINGIVSHNQAPANRFSLSVALAGVDFTDGAGPHWYVSDAGLYDDSLSDLQTFSSGGAQTPNDSVSFSEDYDRINFLSTYLEISLFSGTDSFGPRIAGLDFSDCASGVYCFDEFPNDATKPFFIQRDYRIDGHASFDGALAAAGWLEAAYDAGRPVGCCMDLLFVLDKSEIPEPTTLLLFGTGLLGLLGLHRRRRKTTAQTVHSF